MKPTTKWLEFDVPLVPPSVNHYVKHTRTGQHYVTKEAKAYKEAVAQFARGRFVKAKRYAVKIHIYLAAKQKLDLDNCAKVVLDGLVEAGVIHSDAAITILELRKGRDAANPRTIITIEEAT
jgi:crossover junction endodeoxyribonuclease RusA